MDTQTTGQLVKVPATPLSETGLLIQQAQERGLDASKLYEIYAEERRDERKMAFTQAFAAFSAELPPTMKRSQMGLTNDGIKTSYASLEDIRRHVAPYLHKHGFALTYGNNDAGMMVVTLMHKGGHSIPQMVPFKPDNPKTQAMSELQKVGSGLTYAMRYATTVILGLWFVDYDPNGVSLDDANTITDEQAQTLNDLVIESATERGKLLRHYKITAMGELPAAAFDKACELLNRKIKEAAKV